MPAAGHPVDAFILDRLGRENLKPQPEADRPTLARRVALDLTGLPPGLDEVAAFAADPQRFDTFSLQAPHVFADLSKNLLDAATERLLVALARECGLEQHRDAMFAGAPINTTEGRAVEHTAQRGVGRDTSVEEATALRRLKPKTVRQRLARGATPEGAVRPRASARSSSV